MLLWTLLLLTLKPRLAWTGLVCFTLLCIGFLLSDAFAEGIHNAWLEIGKTSMLFFPLLVSEEPVKRRLLAGLYAGMAMLPLLGLIGFLLNFQGGGLAGIVGGTLLAQSTVGYANTLAVFCGAGLFLSFSYARRRDRYQYLHELLLVLHGLCLLATGSWLGMACVAAAVVVALCIRFQKAQPYLLAVIGLIACAALLLILLRGQNLPLGSTLASRLIYWSDALRLFPSHPFGIGVYGWPEYQYAVQSAIYSVAYVHNGFLQLLLDGGLLALLGGLGIFVFGGIGLLKSYRKTQDISLLYFFCILLLLFLHALVDIDFAYGSIWLMAGIFLSFGSFRELSLPRAVPVFAALALSALCLFLPIRQPQQAVSTTANQFCVAYEQNDAASMLSYAQTWLNQAPRQQEAYDAMYLSLHLLGRESDLAALRLPAQEINQSMHPLSRYLTQHREIVVPE